MISRAEVLVEKHVSHQVWVAPGLMAIQETVRQIMVE